MSLARLKTWGSGWYLDRPCFLRIARPPMYHRRVGGSGLRVSRACALVPDTPEFESWSYHFPVGWLQKFLAAPKPQFTHLKMGISCLPTSYGCSELTYGICQIFSAMSAVATIPIINRNQTISLSHLPVLTRKHTRQCTLGHTLAGTLQGGIIVRSISNLKRDVECVESVQVFELTGKEGG